MVTVIVWSQGIPNDECLPRCCAAAVHSYSAVMALQMLMARPQKWSELILGSPSVCFNPAFLEDIASCEALRAAAASAALSAATPGGIRPAAFILVGDLERQGKVRVGNVHDEMVAGCEQLATTLRGLGMEVKGVEAAPRTDHTSCKLPLVVRGLEWFVARARDAEAAES